MPLPTLTDDFKLVTGLEAKLGHTLANLSWYVDSQATWFDPAVLALIGDRTPMIAIEFWNDRRAAINSGALDAKIAAEAARAVAYDKPIWVRLFHGMNTNLFPWGVSASYAGTGTSDGADPSAFISAWTRIVSAFRGAGADNVSFIFCPNCDTIDALDPAAYWPGSNMVDLIGADGYSPSNAYRSFATTFAPIYSLLTHLHADAPFVVCETACAVNSEMQRTFIQSIAGATPAFPRLISVTWFNVDAAAMNRVEP